jgi:(1->4)-alpha-D-glucan 1-alpha-D-glucosylmutase
MDLSLVDPDNRRPVDYALRARLLEEFQSLRDPRGLLDALHDGRAKLWVAWRLLELRQRLPELFRDGGYLPLAASGKHAEHVLAFARTHARGTVVVVAGRLYAKMLGAAGKLPLGEAWEDTSVALPQNLAAFENVLTGERIEAVGGTVRLAALCARFPLAALRAT